MRSLYSSILLLLLLLLTNSLAGTLETLQSQLSMDGTLRTMVMDHWLEFCPPGSEWGFPQSILAADVFLTWEENSCRMYLLGDLALFDSTTFPVRLGLQGSKRLCPQLRFVYLALYGQYAH